MPKSSAPTAQTINAPAKTFRYGVLKAAIWANQNGDKTFYAVTFSRSYQDEKKDWHDTDSFGRDDLPLISRLAEKAHDWIFDTLTAARE